MGCLPSAPLVPEEVEDRGPRRFLWARRSARQQVTYYTVLYKLKYPVHQIGGVRSDLIWTIVRVSTSDRDHSRT